MLTQEQNDQLTRVGRGTPAGELLRRYWHPVAVAQELTDEQPTKFVRVLGEDLVLFKDKSGGVGLLADHCAHRGASLLYGRVEERGIACAYHGWLYDREGNILETPPERNEAIMQSVKHTAYPVQELAGMYWAYLGPLPAPIIPPYDFLMHGGTPHISIQQPVLDCNWFQCIENTVDPTHAPILHQDSENRRAKPVNTTRGFIDDQPSWDFWLVPYGIMKRRNFANGESDEHPFIFPYILGGTGGLYRVPVDDTHTWVLRIGVRPNREGSDGGAVVTYVEPYKDPPEGVHPYTRFHTRTIIQQDLMAWESQGLIADRTAEHLADGDRAVVAMRRLMVENIEKVQRGEDPMGVIRDPGHPVIDTNGANDLNQTGGKTGRGRPYGISTGTLMDQPVKSAGTRSGRGSYRKHLVTTP